MITNFSPVDPDHKPQLIQTYCSSVCGSRVILSRDVPFVCEDFKKKQKNKLCKMNEGMNESISNE